MVVLLLAQRKLTYTTVANQAQQSLLLPATSSQCMLDPYSQVTTGPVAASEIDKTSLMWQQQQQRLISSDAVQNTVDVQSHANAVPQVCRHLLILCLTCLAS